MEAAVVVTVVASRVVGTATSRPCLPCLTFDIPQNGFFLIQDHFQLIDFVLNVVLTSLGDVLLLWSVVFPVVVGSAHHLLTELQDLQQHYFDCVVVIGAEAIVVVECKIAVAAIAAVAVAVDATVVGLKMAQDAV